MEPSFSLPPVEFCRGASPSQAEKSRPELKTLGSGTLATITVAMSLPTPGTPASNLLIGLCAWTLAISFSSAAIDTSIASSCSTKTFNAALPISGSAASLSAFSISSPACQIPFAATMPNSER